MSAKRDYYEVIGVSKTASPNEIKSQYRKLALKFHPDRNKTSDAAEHFKEISEAYAVLSDPEKRKLYDQYGHAGVDGKYSTEDIFRGASTSFDDILGDLFGSGRGGFGSIFESLLGRVIMPINPLQNNARYVNRLLYRCRLTIYYHFPGSSHA